MAPKSLLKSLAMFFGACRHKNKVIVSVVCSLTKHIMTKIICDIQEKVVSVLMFSVSVDWSEAGTGEGVL